MIARDRSGTLRASYNMCVHRGVEVAQGCGNAKAFKCPYHGWIYDLDGRLTGAAYMKESVGFALAGQRMRPLRLETWAGNVFVSFDPDAAPLAEHLRESLDALESTEREAIELAFYGGYTYRQVAQILELPEGTVKSRIRTGLKRMRDRLVAADIGGPS